MTDGSSPRSGRIEGGEIATSTLAEIYAQQGLLGRALAIYRRMLHRMPDDVEVAERIRGLEQRIAESGSELAMVRAPDPSPERERLPWDPPAESDRDVGVERDVAVESGEPERLASEETPGEEEPAVAEPHPIADGARIDEAAGTVSEPPRRVGPIDPRAFEAWLERR